MTEREDTKTRNFPPMITNNLRNDIPIRSATMTRNRSKIRKDLNNLIKSLNSITEYAKKLLVNTINVRNKDMRNIAKMISKVWTHILRKVWTFFQRTHTNPKKTEEYWSPKNCGECDICVQRGPQSLCPYCNAELIGFVNYLKVNTEIIITLPSDILKSIAWTLIKYPLLNTLEKALAHLIYHETIPFTGLLIRLRTTITLLKTNTPRVNRKHDKTGNSGERETRNNGREGRKKPQKRRTNLTWHLRHKKRESLKEKPRTGSTGTNLKKGKDTIAQYDGNDDPISDTEIDDTPLENVQASTYGWHKTESPNYPKGIKFWSDPNKPPEVIITDDPPPSNPPKTGGAFVWKNESDEEEVEDIQIPDNEFERTEIMTINVRSCYSGTKRMEVRDGILEANPDVVIVTETWLLEGDQDLMVPGYIPIRRCDRRNTNSKKLPASERGGGVLVIAKDYITITEAESHQVDKYIQVVSFILDKVSIFAVYRSPKTLKGNHQNSQNS